MLFERHAVGESEAVHAIEGAQRPVDDGVRLPVNVEAITVAGAVEGG